MKNMLQNLVNDGGQCVNLGRSMKVRHPELHAWVLESTPWIPETAKFNERVYCILNNITEPVMDAHGTPAKFSDINTGYLMREASAQGAISKKEKEIIKEAKRKEKESKPVLSDFDKAIAKVLRRTKNRNPQFYAPDAVEGVDYVVCPVSQARFRHIRADHITNVLGMTLDEFNAKFPETKMVAQGRIEAIKRGLSVITDNGLTVHQNAHQKAVETLQSVGADGMRGYDKLGAKTRATHLGQVDENGLNGYQRQVKSRLETISENGLSVMQNSLIKRDATLTKTMVNGTGGASKASKIALEPIINILELRGVKYYFDTHEYRVTDTDNNVVYSFDLTIPDFGIAIEYNSNAYHADPRLTDSEWSSWRPVRGELRSASDVYLYDMNKARALYKFRNYLTFFVWENSIDIDVENVISFISSQFNDVVKSND